MPKTLTESDKRFLSNARAHSRSLIVAATIFLLAGMIASGGLYYSEPDGSLFLAPDESGESNALNFNGLLLLGVVLSLFILFAIQIMSFMVIKRLLVTVTDSEEKISKDMDSLTQSKNDDIKELVTTRSMIMTKLNDKKAKKIASR